VVIDLNRLPSQGRDLGIALRTYKTTRQVPLVFVDGDPEKVARIREILPDAVYTSGTRSPAHWRRPLPISRHAGRARVAHGRLFRRAAGQETGHQGRRECRLVGRAARILADPGRAAARRVLDTGHG